MNILFYGMCSYKGKNGKTKLYSGGTERFNNWILLALSSFEGFKVDYIYNTASEKYGKEYLQDPDYSNLRHCIRDHIDNRDSFEKLLNDNSYDIVIISDAFPGNSSPLYDLILKFAHNNYTPIIVFSHGFNCGIHRCFHIFKEDNYNYTICASTVSEIEYFRNNGFNCKFLDYPADAEGVDNFSDFNNDQWICVARLVPQKGIENAINLAKSQNKSLIIVGKGYALKSKFEQMYSKVKIYSWISHEELSELIQSSQFSILLPNSKEGVSFVVRESLILGVPVITWDDYFKESVDLTNSVQLPHDNYIEYYEEFIKPIEIDRYSNLEYRNNIRESSKNRFSFNAFKENLLELIERG